METTQVAKKQKTDETETAPIATQSMMIGSTSIADTTGRTSETAVTIPPTITYGLQDTHTTILPAICWFSAPNLPYDFTPKTFALRLNSIYDLMHVGTTSVSAPAESATSTFWSKKCGEKNYKTGETDGYAFPSEGMNQFVPWYREYYEKLYQYYTVLGCEYEIVMCCPCIAGRKALVATSIETTGSTESTSTVLPINVPLRELYGMKNIQFEEVNGRDSAIGQNNFAIIKGQYKPGTGKRDVSNDGDVKLWIKTASDGTGSSPTFVERLQVMAYAHPFYNMGNDQNGVINGAEQPPEPHSEINLNFQVRVKYIVQFKQLYSAARYPINGQTATSNIQFPSSGSPYN